jgi:hypothetical protein
MIFGTATPTVLLACEPLCKLFNPPQYALVKGKIEDLDVQVNLRRAATPHWLATLVMLTSA